jgi:TIR domain
MLAALERCDWFVVLLSPAAIESMWVRRETAFALNERRYENRIVPVQIEACDLRSMKWLGLFQIIDLRPDFEAGMRELVRVWGIGLRPKVSG